MRTLLAPLRIVLLIAHILAGIAITWALFPLLAQSRRNRIIRGWSRLLLIVCGTRLRLTGLPLPPVLARTGIEPGRLGRMLLANHVSWIDVFAIHAAVPSVFVAKAEIGDWPLLGMLVTRVGTLYIERGRRHAVAATNQRVRNRLRGGETVAVFPEGTTTDGRWLRPFHANLIEPARETGAECWPLAIRYTESGTPSTAAAFIDDMRLATSLWRILVARRLQIELAFLEPVPTGGDRDRHHVAQVAAERIAAWLSLPPPPARRVNSRPPPAADTADSAPAAADATASRAP